MLRYINKELCEAVGSVRPSGSSASFYYILGVCGSAAQGG
jgi:hypothetical protein